MIIQKSDHLAQVDIQAHPAKVVQSLVIPQEGLHAEICQHRHSVTGTHPHHHPFLWYSSHAVKVQYEKRSDHCFESTHC